MLNQRQQRDVHREFLNAVRSITQLVTPVALDVPDVRSVREVRSLALGKGRPVPLRGPGRVSLQVRLRYRLIEDAEGWSVRIVAYQYAILDQTEREIVAYHWHPDGESAVGTPHCHLGAGAGAARAELNDAHLPTGPVPLTAVVRLAVEAFRAQPARRNWHAVLTEIEETFPVRS